MTGAESFVTFGLGVAQRVIATAVIGIGKKIDPTRLLPLRAYRRRLLLRMEDMPFLYKDMRLSARDDYVEPQVATAIDEIQRSVGNPDLNFKKPFMRFDESRRALLFGEGGYGKTTLFRHLTIRCLQQTRKKPVLDGKSLVPVFVALKTARTSSDFPILDAIRRSDEYFEGDAGLRRLRRLARRNRLLVFLDGYDEMPHAGGLTHVQKELKTIFGKYSSRAPDFFEVSEYGAIYKALQNCRVYLSSRREFFFYSSFYVHNEVQKWVIKGLEDRRIELVEKIFDNYRDSTTASSGLDLDAELFMQELKRTADGELLQLSRSPLFLTVMCFVYVSEIRLRGKTSVFEHGAYEIINECISLLASELDIAKAKGLTGAQRIALTNRRSAFAREKLEFLRYFAVHLYERSTGLFDREFLSDAAARFFRGCNSENRDEILRGLRSDDPTVNVVEQIILSGLFVLVDRHKSVDYFDFPHRRFRETLAVSHFNNPAGANDLAKHLLDSSYGELILVYIDQSEYKQVIFESIINEVVSGASPNNAVELFTAAIERVSDHEAEELFSRLLDRMGCTRMPQIPSILLKYAAISPAHSRLVAEKLRHALDAQNNHLLALWAEVGASVDLIAAQETIISMAHGMNVSQLRQLIYSSLASLDSRNELLLESYLRKAALDGSQESAILDIHKKFVVGRDESARKQFKAFLALMVSRISNCEGTHDVLALRASLGRLMNALGAKDGKGDEVAAPPPAPWSPWR